MTDPPNWKRIELPEETAEGADEQRPRPGNRAGWGYRKTRYGPSAKTATKFRPLDSGDGER